MSTRNTRVENYSLLVSGSPTIHKVADGMCHGMGSPLKEPPPLGRPTDAVTHGHVS